MGKTEVLAGAGIAAGAMFGEQQMMNGPSLEVVQSMQAQQGLGA